MAMAQEEQFLKTRYLDSLILKESLAPNIFQIKLKKKKILLKKIYIQNTH